MRVAVFQIDGWQKEYLSAALVKFGHEVVCVSSSLDAEHLPDSGTEAVSVFVGSSVDRKVMEALPNMKLITTRSTGFDHIDLAAAREKNISLGYVPSYGENTVAEFAFGLILTLSRKLFPAIDRIKETSDFSFEGLEGFDLKGKTIGVVGTGRIGRHVIRIAKGFGMEVVAYDAFPNKKLAEEMNFPYVPFPEVLGVSDVLTLHVPYLKETHHLISNDNIFQMKKGAILINTSRGPVVETEALVRALKEGHLGGAGLDVLEEEGALKDEMGFVLKEKSANEESFRKIIANHILMDLPNVVITPHNAFNTREAITRILDADIQNIVSFAESGAVESPIPEI